MTDTQAKCPVHEVGDTACGETELCPDPLARWIAQDIASGRRAERFTRQADALERLLPKSSRDISGNSVETITAELRRVAAQG